MVWDEFVGAPIMTNRLGGMFFGAPAILGNIRLRGLFNHVKPIKLSMESIASSPVSFRDGKYGPFSVAP